MREARSGTRSPLASTDRARVPASDARSQSGNGVNWLTTEQVREVRGIRVTHFARRGPSALVSLLFRPSTRTAASFRFNLLVSSSPLKHKGPLFFSSPNF